MGRRTSQLMAVLVMVALMSVSVGSVSAKTFAISDDKDDVGDSEYGASAAETDIWDSDGNAVTYTDNTETFTMTMEADPDGVAADYYGIYLDTDHDVTTGGKFPQGNKLPHENITGIEKIIRF